MDILETNADLFLVQNKNDSLFDPLSQISFENIELISETLEQDARRYYGTSSYDSEVII